MCEESTMIGEWTVGSERHLRADDDRPMIVPVHSNPSRRSVLTAVVRRLWPCLVQATLIPTALCYAGLVVAGLAVGIAAAAVWVYLAIVFRLATRRPVSGLLTLATIGFTIRLVTYAFNENALVYFMQPIARSLVVALLFAGSAIIGRPFVARFARDFCSFSPDVANRPAIASLFRRLTLLWAGAQGLTAAANLALLLTVPTAVFVGTAAATAWLLMGLGTVITVVDAVNTTRGDGLLTTVSRGGHLHAFVAH
jgi:hypothetical protein